MYGTILDFIQKVSCEGGFVEAVSGYGLNINKDLSQEAQASNPDFVKAWNKALKAPVKKAYGALRELNAVIQRDYPGFEPI